MPSITPGSNLSALVRAQLDAARASKLGAELPKAGPRTETSSNPRSMADTSSPGQELGTTDLPPAALARLQAIAEDDPQRHRKAFRIFLESALLRELGNQLQADDAFPRLVDQVLDRMEEDAELRQASISAAEGLLQQVNSPGPVSRKT